jgi:sugar/nucleoside kinase (ribokinase family)
MGITIHGAGCALVDYLYREIDFEGEGVIRYRSRTAGDGGLNVGGLVFAQALEQYAGKSIDAILRELVSGRPPDRENVGGPAIVSLINTAQLLPHVDVRFFGAVGTDEAGRLLRDRAGRTPLDASGLQTRDGATAATYVLSDPSYAAGHGERMFINLLGVAAELTPEDLGSDFVQADIVQLGGTALVPRLHAELPRIVREAKQEGALTIVNTVYDFRSESSRPRRRWTLGSDDAYPNVDLLIADAEEARKLTGRDELPAALDWFLDRGVGAAVVTNGPEPVWFAAGGGRPAADGNRFTRTAASTLPVFTQFARSPEVRAAEGDTTGCGDNFAGGLVAGIAEQIRSGSPRLELEPAVRTAIASGAFCLTHLGGTYVEPEPGAKRRHVASVRSQYEAAIWGAP